MLLVAALCPDFEACLSVDPVLSLVAKELTVCLYNLKRPDARLFNVCCFEKNGFTLIRNTNSNEGDAHVAGEEVNLLLLF